MRGQLVEWLPTQITVEVAGIGYEAFISLNTFERLPLPPKEVKLLAYLQVKEDAHTLYAFATADERDLFKLLVAHVSGIGPKSALAILSATTPQFERLWSEDEVGIDFLLSHIFHLAFISIPNI